MELAANMDELRGVWRACVFLFQADDDPLFLRLLKTKEAEKLRINPNYRPDNVRPNTEFMKELAQAAVSTYGIESTIARDWLEAYTKATGADGISVADLLALLTEDGEDKTQ